MRRVPVLMMMLLLSAGLLRAQPQVVIYRCTDASGAVTVQNDVRCPKASKQEKRIIDVPPPMPQYKAAAPQPKPAPQAPPETVADVAAKAGSPAIAAADRTPPPALFTCKAAEGDTYFSDNGESPQRCIRMQTTGIGGNPGMGAGEACMMVSDACTPVEEMLLCAAWKRRVDEAEFRWKFAKAGDRDPRKLEYERLANIVRESNCAM